MAKTSLLLACLTLVLPACGPPNPAADPTNPPEIAPSDTKPSLGTDPITNAPPGAPPSPDATPTTPSQAPATPGPASGTGTQ
jgi:hypothetical protein